MVFFLHHIFISLENHGKPQQEDHELGSRIGMGFGCLLLGFMKQIVAGESMKHGGQRGDIILLAKIRHQT